MIKLSLYIVLIPITMYVMESINFNNFFKKNKYVQSQVFFVFMSFIISYLLVNFFYDFINIFNIEN